MKTKGNLLRILGGNLAILLIVFFPIYSSYSQCNQPLITIEQCDMENVDFDMDGNPDGILNLYNETGTTPADGVWSINPRFDIALDPASGNLSMWTLENSTIDTTINEYFFELRNVATCGTDPVITARLILGPYSGIALPAGPNDANTEICDNETLDLFEVLASEATIPPPHLNGQWEYVGSSSGAGFEGSFELDGSVFSAEIPYDEGLPIVDREVFELKYTVGGIATCSSSQETTVKISVVRMVDAGIPSVIKICEEDLKAGLYDADINLRDDQYLRDEDVEGIWLVDEDTTGEIEDEQDSMINLRKIYDDLIDNGSNIRFGCETYEFTYRVISRSPVCIDDSAIVKFIFFEELRPFEQQVAVPEICANEEPGDFDLYNLLTFTTESGLDFVYNNEFFVNWQLVSGPSKLGLRSQNEVGFTHLGTINTLNATPGIYTFEYAVSPLINCPNLGVKCNPFSPPIDPSFECFPACDVLSAEVTIEILPFDYSGEDTADIDLCESLGQVSLRSLLTTSGTNTVVNTGVWTNQNGDIIDNVFVFPDLEMPQTFSFTYTTTSSDGCIESSNLSFTIFTLPDAGNDANVPVCSDDLTVTLFDHINTLDTSGTWTGPFGYTSTDHLGVFDVSDTMLPILGEGIYTYTVPGNAGCNTADESAVTIRIINPIVIGNDRSETFCKIDGRVNLFSLLDRNTPRTGIFQDTDITGALVADGVLEFETLTNRIYNFRYVIENTLPCDESSLTVSVQIVDLPEPNVPEQEFCILDAKRLEDIEVDVLNFNWYATLESETPIVDNPLLFDGQMYYITNVDVDNCESERVEVLINILNTGEKFSNGELCTLDFQDGVSPNGDNQNDTFDLLIEDVYNIPEAFPGFDIKIYNRYGTLVYEGRRDTEEFRGTSNVSIRLGDDLPSGTYFYIFSPNFENNLPIQGSFYLSR